MSPESIPPPERENPETPLSTEQVLDGIRKYQEKINQQRQPNVETKGAAGDSGSSETQS